MNVQQLAETNQPNIKLHYCPKIAAGDKAGAKKKGKRVLNDGPEANVDDDWDFDGGGEYENGEVGEV